LTESQFPRILVSREALRFQGIVAPSGILDAFGDRFLHDLAGNAFSSTVFSSMFFSVLLAVSALMEKPPEMPTHMPRDAEMHVDHNGDEDDECQSQVKRVRVDEPIDSLWEED
jgi:hypothetical protein